MQCKICLAPLELWFSDLCDDRYGYPGTFSVYRCSLCGFAQLHPVVSVDQLEDLYTNYYPRKTITAATVTANSHAQDQWLMGNPNVYHRFPKPGQRVLDVGCGDGASLLMIQSQGAEAYGTEFDHNVEVPAKQLGLKIHMGDINTAPYPDHYFDLITLNQLIEHVVDPIEFIKTLKRKLKPNGKIVITTPRLGGLQQRWSGRRWVNWHIPYHVNFFTPRSFELLAQHADMRVTSWQTFTPMGWVVLQWLSWLSPAPKPGIASWYWKPRPTNLTKLQYLRQLGWRATLSLVMAHTASWISLPFYRLVDRRRQGDSFLIVLQP